MDCTHVYWDKCPVGLANICTGKEKSPTLAFQCVVDHARHIHHISTFFYGSYNDKNITMNDSFPIDVYNGLYKDEDSL